MKIYHFTILFSLFFLVFWFVTDYEISNFENNVYKNTEFERVFNKASYKAAEYYFKEGNKSRAYEEFCKMLKEYREADEYEIFFAVVEEGEAFVMSGEDEKEAAAFLGEAERSSVVAVVKNMPEIKIVSGASEKAESGYLLEQRDYYKLYHEEQGNCIGGFIPLKRLETQKECAEEGAFACRCVKTGTYFYEDMK